MAAIQAYVLQRKKHLAFHKVMLKNIFNIEKSMLEWNIFHCLVIPELQKKLIESTDSYLQVKKQHNSCCSHFDEKLQVLEQMKNLSNGTQDYYEEFFIDEQACNQASKEIFDQLVSKFWFLKIYNSTLIICFLITFLYLLPVTCYLLPIL